MRPVSFGRIIGIPVSNSGPQQGQIEQTELETLVQKASDEWENSPTVITYHNIDEVKLVNQPEPPTQQTQRVATVHVPDPAWQAETENHISRELKRQGVTGFFQLLEVTGGTYTKY